jgi:Tol biopolymer transport system component
MPSAVDPSRLKPIRVLLVATVVATSNAGASATSLAAKRRDGVIVFAGVAANTSGLYVINPDGSGQRRLLGGLDSYPAWSPDGKRIAFSRERGKQHDLNITNANGTSIRTLFTTGKEPTAGGVVPTWSPDGSTIAFCSERSGTLAIYVIRLDGSGLRQLTHDKGGSCEPDWSPDGKSIVFGTVGAAPAKRSM